MSNFNSLPLEQQKAILKEVLRESVVTVEFTKVNGEHRVMPCTLREDLIPPAPVKEGVVKERKVNPDVIRVFCTDKQEWRSFRIDSVTKISV